MKKENEAKGIVNKKKKSPKPPQTDFDY
jgi:hypothetical protein